MNSGKSLLLLATAHNFHERGIPFIILKSTIDTRDGADVVHSRALGDKECLSVSPSDNIYNIIQSIEQLSVGYCYDNIKWIHVDEAQFLTEKQVDELAAIADNFNINVICYGLRTDFRTKLFPGSKRLFEVADSLEEIKSSCSCNSKTIFNARIDKEGNVVTNGEQIEVGGNDRYVALCRKCYYQKINHPLYVRNLDEDNLIEDE
jgi:thymidine kinase